MRHCVCARFINQIFPSALGTRVAKTHKLPSERVKSFPFQKRGPAADESSVWQRPVPRWPGAQVKGAAPTLLISLSLSAPCCHQEKPKQLLCPCPALLHQALSSGMKNPQRDSVLLALVSFGFFGGGQGQRGLEAWLEFCSQVCAPSRHVLPVPALPTATSSAGFSVSHTSASPFLCPFLQLTKRQPDTGDLAVPTLFNFLRVCAKGGWWFRPTEWNLRLLQPFFAG